MLFNLQFSYNLHFGSKISKSLLFLFQLGEDILSRTKVESNDKFEEMDDNSNSWEMLCRKSALLSLIFLESSYFENTYYKYKILLEDSF